MINTTSTLPTAIDTSNYSDFSSLTELKAKAGADRQGAAKQAAEQFEAIFLQMMMQGMRQAKLTDGMFDGQAMEKYTDMHDKQLSVSMAQNGGIGLAPVIERQLLGESFYNGQTGRDLNSYRQQPVYQSALESQLQVRNQHAAKQEKIKAAEFDGSVESFVDKLKPHAQKAAAVLGVQPEALLAQAALETGWGKFQTKMADGTPSYNLFNIKADSRWDGNKANVSTLEFRDGIAKKERANFRAYESYEQAFDDYARFLQDNPRYQHALKNTADPKAYFKQLQQAGYATDPEYANKILNVLENSGIKTALNTSASINEDS